MRKLINDARGATAIEYGLIAALIAVACIFALDSLGSSLAGVFNTVADNIAGSSGSPGPPSTDRR